MTSGACASAGWHSPGPTLSLRDRSAIKASVGQKIVTEPYYIFEPTLVMDAKTSSVSMMAVHWPTHQDD